MNGFTALTAQASLVDNLHTPPMIVFQVVVIVSLLAVLIWREIVRTAGQPDSEQKLKILDRLTIFLLLVFGGVVFLRLMTFF